MNAPRRVLALALLLAPVTASAAHPLAVDDAGTLRPGERELELASRPVASERGFSATARTGLDRRTDVGASITWAEGPAEDPVYELVVDLKWAPGHALRWRPRPFLRPDFALLVEAGQAQVSVAGIGAGLTWEGPAGLLSVEATRTEPLETTWVTTEAWSIATGCDLRLLTRWRLAAEWRQLALGRQSTEQVRLGVVCGFGRGDLSLGLRTGRSGGPDLLLGWTAGFGG